MKDDKRYSVETRWGFFSLDEGAYQDYLAGKLWITWEPGKREEERKREWAYKTSLPSNISFRAKQLYEHAEKLGFIKAFQLLDTADIKIPYNARLGDIGIDAMYLTTRSSKALLNVNVKTFRNLKVLLDSDSGIERIRNLGAKSTQEIREAFSEECYNRLEPYEKVSYWQEVVESLKSDAE